MNSTIESLNKIIPILTEMKRFKELIETLNSWEKEFVTDIGKVTIFHTLVDIKPTHIMDSLKRIEVRKLKEDLKYYKDMMDTNYPKARLLNKLVSEYNSLFDIYGKIDVDYVVSDFRDKLSRLGNLKIDKYS